MGRIHTNQFAHGNRPPPHLRGTAPLTNLAGAGGRRTVPLGTQAGAGKRTLLLPPPRPPTRALHTTHLRTRSWPGQSPEGAGGVRVGEGAAAAAAAARCVHSTPTRASQPIPLSQRALSPRATSAANPDTFSATAPTRIYRQTTTAVPE